jgi:integrase
LTWMAGRSGSNFSRQWRKALTKAGLNGYHIHDLRHTGNTFASWTGATLKDLMGRMGHASTRAALIYRHTTGEQDRRLADSLDALMQDELKRRPKTGQPEQSGTDLARPEE